ncbi:pimeloyl-ACP methyl ester carboxylesterase [Tenacibaculum skagerrakense]|uniref:Pimeloyl-ACP methyl ester carboxylesterase n=1 Tax=Tenacibaculum skagerrakense TaxID=186571 RepID=A0A4V2SMD3_9FLAO|nr:alpha/beta fold hydrolase [Tenacibaculum skagerrakense]TCP26826.1 pimeloyl-ACP methyl ester carboxylesterase [Tenacibaculum skagerrakense]
MFKKIVKIVSIIILVLIVSLYIVFTVFTSPKSDEQVLEAYENSYVKPILTKEKFKEFTYRKIEIKKDTSLSTLVFVHGTIGSLNDFSKYLSDSLLQHKFNMIAYDRIGYNYKDENPVQESIAFEREMLLDIIKDLNKDKVVLVGYSYGGPIALSVKEKVKKIILLAPAVHSKVEPMPWMLNFYKWKLTRWLVPKVWKQASKEKLSHREDLKKFEKEWSNTPNKVVSIHGTSDWIVPYENSKLLQEQFDSNQFQLVDLEKGNHGLVWSNFDFIKEQLLKHAD